MQMSELIATLHHELVKSYTYIADTKNSDNPETSVLHISIERVEIELPVTFSEQEIEFNPTVVKGIPETFKKLYVPFTSHKETIPKKTVKGKTVTAEIIGHMEKIDDRITPESIGRIKVVFKQVIS